MASKSIAPAAGRCCGLQARCRQPASGPPRMALVGLTAVPYNPRSWSHPRTDFAIFACAPMSASDIVIKGAREHNLRDIESVLPRNRLICLTGVSGSGKSSLAFDTLYAEGQRRYVESLSSFARQFLGQMPKPDVDLISRLEPFDLDLAEVQRPEPAFDRRHNHRDLRLSACALRPDWGQGHCPKCSRPITAQSREQILDRLGTLPAGTRFSLSWRR